MPRVVVAGVPIRRPDGEKGLREDGAGAELELGGLLVEDRHPGHVRRQQVGRALQPLEGTPDAAGQGAGEHRLGHAGHVFEQDVPLAQVRRQGQGQLRPLADDHLLHVGDDLRRRTRHVDFHAWGARWVVPSA